MSPPRPPNPSPSGPSLGADVTAGFLVFLIALPLCLGISMASGFPPIAGVLTAIVGGVVVTFLGSARLTIKGPAAGLIVIAVGAVQELGGGDVQLGYRRALAVGVVAGALQIVFALTRAGVVGDLMPPSVVHGMLAAIGVIILSKQAHTVLGVSPEEGSPLALLARIPESLRDMNPEIAVIGAVSLAILFGLPLLPWRAAKRFPAPMVVLLVAVPIGLAFDLTHEHTYSFAAHAYRVGPQYLVQLPGNLLDAVATPDFSAIATGASVKYVAMFSLVGSVESLLSVSAVDALDPEKRSSDLNRDLLATGVGNVVSAAIGGLPMISEIVRSKANIDNGATTRRANFLHGAFLLLFVALVPGLLQRIPLAALGAMLVYTGARLASPRELVYAYRIGPEQLLLFTTTLVVTLATDLLVGVAVGLTLKLVIHLKNGAPLRSLFRAALHERRRGDDLLIEVHEAAIFTNLIGLRRRLSRVEDDVRRVVVDFRAAWVVDHTVLEKLHAIANEWRDRTLVVTGLEHHVASSAHVRAARRLPRVATTGGAP